MWMVLLQRILGNESAAACQASILVAVVEHVFCILVSLFDELRMFISNNLCLSLWLNNLMMHWLWLLLLSLSLINQLYPLLHLFHNGLLQQQISLVSIGLEIVFQELNSLRESISRHERPVLSGIVLLVETFLRLRKLGLKLCELNRHSVIQIIKLRSREDILFLLV